MPFFPKDFGFTAAKVRRRQGHAVVVITGGKTAVGGHGYAAGTGNDHRRRCHAEKAVSPFDFPPPFQGAVTAEYAVVIMGAVAFAGLLVVILGSEEVRGMLVDLVQRALGSAG